MSMRLKNPVLLMALAAVYPIAGDAATAARIDFVSGDAILVSAGTQRSLTKGSEIADGDTVRTGETGRVQLRFSDGALVSLQPQTEFRVESYVYNGRNDGQEKGFFALLKGGLRTITGAIGKANTDRYKVSTNVATIGIRGTEYSANYTDKDAQKLLVHTGEGQIEVCNSAGCVLVSGGESATVTGRSEVPARSSEKPYLPPRQPDSSLAIIYALGENRSSTGGIPAPYAMPSGSAYAIAHGDVSGVAQGTGSVAFDNSSLATNFSSGGNTYQASLIQGGFSLDGVVAWGTWATGAKNGSIPLSNYHYAVVVPTPLSDFSALLATTQTLTYHLAGFTTPTANTGVTVSAPTATLTASFVSSVSAGVSLNMGMTIGGTYQPFLLSGSSSNGSFSLSNGSSSAEGFFGGANASHAGLTYHLDTGTDVVVGAAAFKR